MSTEEETCPDCQATETNMDARVIKVRKDEATGDMITTITWHAEDCPAHTVERILLEDRVRRAKERDEWAKGAFPAAHERLKAAADEAGASPFVAALLELVAKQGEDLGRYVPTDRWAEILDRHFPAEDDEPTA